MTSDPSPWTCSVCLITNDAYLIGTKEPRTQCESCEVDRNGNAPSVSTPAAAATHKPSLTPSTSVLFGAPAPVADFFQKLVNPYEEQQAWEAGKALVWGSGECDQIPLSSREEEAGVLTTAKALDYKEQFVQVCCGPLHTVALTESGKIVTFGCNDDGALGRHPAADKEAIPDEVNIGEKCLEVASGDSHGCVRTESGKVWVWGVYKATSGKKYTATGTTSEPQELPLPFPALSIKSGSNFTVAVCYDEAKDARLGYFWGVNTFGQMGKVASEDWTGPVEVPIPYGQQLLEIFAGSGTVIIKSVGGDQVYEYNSAGKNGTGECGVGSTSEQIEIFTKINPLRGFCIAEFAFGDFHVLALTKSGDVWAWGLSDAALPHGGERKALRVPLKLETDLGPVRMIRCGGQTSMAVTQANVLMGWGDSSTGQLQAELDDCSTIRQLDLGRSLLKNLSVASQHVVALHGKRSGRTRLRINKAQKMKQVRFKQTTKKAVDKKRVDAVPPRRSARIAANARKLQPVM